MSEQEQTLPVITVDFEQGLNVPVESLRDMLGELECTMKNAPQIDIPLKHYFSPGVYGREVFMPKGLLVIGKIHKNQTMNVISAGEVSVLSVDGLMRIKAPFTFVSSPGAKRLLYIHEDCTWSTFHGTEETDIEKIEDEFIAKTYDDVFVSLDAVRNMTDVSLLPEPVKEPVISDVVIEEIV